MLSKLAHTKVFSTFGAASIDDFATVLAFHPLTEAVSAEFRHFVRLVSSFHIYPLKWFKSDILAKFS